MAEQPPRHPKITPERAARLILQTQKGSLCELTREIREQVETYGPAEAQINSQMYTIWPGEG